MPGDDDVAFDVEADLLAELSGTPPEDKQSAPKSDDANDNLRSSLARGDADPLADNEPKGDVDEILPDDPLYVAPDDADDVTPVADNKPVTKGGIFDLAAQYGVDLSKYKTEAEAQAGLVQAQKLLGQRDDLATYGKRLIDDPKGVLAYLKSLYPDEVPKVEEAKVAPPKSDAPEYDPSWNDLFDAEGKLLPGADPTVPVKLAKYHKWLGDRARDFAADPVAKLLPLLQDQIRDMAKKEAEALVQKSRRESDAERSSREQKELAASLIKEEASWAYVEGDANKGITPEGNIFWQYLQALETPDQNGNVPIPDMRTRKEVAKLMTRDALSRVQKKDNSIDRDGKQKQIGKKPNRQSAVDPSERGWPKGLSLEDALLRMHDKQ